MNLRNPDTLNKLNSVTKYPSILTYHALGEKGTLKPEVLTPFPDGTRLVGTEKVDGTNFRVIFAPDEDGSIILGSREDLLWEYRDLIGNDMYGCIPFFKKKIEDYLTVKPYTSSPFSRNDLTVFYGEFYGGNIGPSKNYTKTGKFGFRLFDVMEMPAEKLDEVMAMPIDKISSWRQHGGQSFVHFDALPSYATILDCDVVPVKTLFDSAVLPTDLVETADFVKTFGETSVALDDGATKRVEGIVVRTLDRSVIAKLRNEDYEKTLKKMVVR